MPNEEGDACVYVKESVLHELEQERRRLKWQLSRALQTSDSRAAELEANKAKVKDLLTIVEVNKGVADQILQRSHGRDVKRREELEALHQQNRLQRQRYVDLVTRSMNRRVRDRRQREVFRSLHDLVFLRSQRRDALSRTQARSRSRVLRKALERWKCYSYTVDCGTGSAKVHPVSQEQMYAMQSSFASGPPLAQRRCSTSKIVANDNSKQFLRWQLLRKVWRNWERVIRWRRKHNKLLKVATRRLLFSRFAVWRSRARVLRRRKLVLRRIFARTRRRLQQHGISSLRLRCAEVAAHEWAEVLKAAHIAMQEEKQLRAEVQSAAANELHTAYTREQHRQQRFKELQVQRLEDFKRRQRLHRTLMMLRCEVIRTHQQNAIALRFQRLQHHQRQVRKFFTAWKCKATRSRRIKTLVSYWRARRICSAKAKFFKLFVQTLQRRRQRRVRLRGLTTKVRRAWLLRGWLRLRIRSALEERNAIAHVERWEFSQQAVAMRNVYQEDTRRSRKVALKYQITCALLMADKKQDKLLRRVLSSWSKRTSINLRQRRTLRRLIALRHVALLRVAIREWKYSSEEMAERCSQLFRYQCTRRHRTMEYAFDNWKSKTHENLRTRLIRYQQRSCFCAWRQWHYLRQQRIHWFGLFLNRSRRKWQRQAFQSWKQKHAYYVKMATKRENTDQELVSRLWRRWLGFITSRLHKQRRQQQKALSGVRSGLQQTILSTVFISWRRNWEVTKSREDVIVRSFRKTTRTTRICRCLQAWNRRTVLMARRRTALRIVCRRYDRRRLQIRWHQWFRELLYTKIVMLEISSIQAELQVERVVRSTSRTSTLRRMLRQWKRVSGESKLQQRRRALFAEKRRYIALQASLRQWQRQITCCPLGKQHRVLQRLLNSLRLSIERHAFRFWERSAHLKTLLERDRISAELLHRSEIRVMTLAEEIRADKERRVIFASWKSITSRKKQACEILQTLLLKHQRRLLQNSCTKWKMLTQREHCIMRLQAIITEQQKAHAWHKLCQMYRHHDLRSTGARRAAALWHKILLRHRWNQWKRADRVMAKLAAFTEANTSTIAFKRAIVTRHHTKRFTTAVFTAWKHRIICIKRLRHCLCVVLKRQVEVAIAYHFQRWRDVVERLNHAEQILLRLVKHEQLRKMRSALAHWNRWTLEMAHRQQMEQTKRALSHQRQACAQRVAVVKFLSWQRPCLEFHFIRWKVVIEQRRRYVVDQLAAILLRRTRYLLQSAWRSWCDLICQSKRRTLLLAKVLHKTRLGLLSFGLYRWDQWSSWTMDIKFAMTRMVKIRTLGQWRRGLAALRTHRHEVIRRQSVLAAAAFSSHSARQREHRAKLMRAVAFALQKKTSTAFCDRCFRHWFLYVRTKTKMNSMVRQTRARLQKRAVRRCFIEWLLYTQHIITLQLKIRRRRQTWEHRRQQNVWSAWVLFTQHSLDIKHLIYDRMVICALRHNLHGAWSRWKSYTTHANGLLNAQRVAQWEQVLADHDKTVSTLEGQNERLLLRATQLGQQYSTLRQRLMGSGARKIHHVVELGHKSRVFVAFNVWKHKLRQIQVLQSLMVARAIRNKRFAFHSWHLRTLQLRASEVSKRVQANTGERAARLIHTYSTQWLKRQILVSLKAFMQARKGIQRHIAAGKWRRKHKLVRHCWSSWKSALDTRDRQEIAVTALRARRTLKLSLRTYWQWRGAYKRSGFAKQKAMRTLMVLRRGWMHRILLHSWGRWRSFLADGDATLLQTELTLLKLDQQNAALRHACSQLLLTTFSKWRLHTRSQCKVREGHVQMLIAASRRRLFYRQFGWWKQEVTRRRRQLLLLRRMGRHLSRHCMTLKKFSFWVWFAKVQANSRALTYMATQLQVTSKQFTPATDVPGRIARALLTDLALAEHRVLRSQQRNAWRLVNATVRNAHRRLVQSAFNRLAGSAVIGPQLSVMPPIHTVNARAFIDKLTTVLLRSGFLRWKRQYVSLALQEAEEAQQELLRALHHVTSYRQTQRTSALRGEAVGRCVHQDGRL